MNFATQLEKKTALVYDLRLEINDEDRFFIIKVTPAMQQAFLDAVMAEEGFRLEDFGTILYRGWGEPPDDLKQELQERYGMYPDNHEKESEE